MGKTTKKKTKGPASRPASTSEIPDEKSDLDEENLDVSSSPEDRRRKLPTLPTLTAAQPSIMLTGPEQSAVEQAIEEVCGTIETKEKYVVYMKGVEQDIIAAVKAQDVKFAREIESIVGPIVLMKFRGGCLRITCSSKTQEQKLLECTEFMGVAVVVTLPWTGADKALKKAEEMDKRPVRFNKIVISVVSAQWSDEDIAEETSAAYVRRIKRRVDGTLEPTSTVILGYIDNPPDYVTMAYRAYRTRAYVEKPRQCHNCLRYGHLKAACRSKVRCPRCAGAHTYDECTKKDDPEQVRCAHCGDAHSEKTAAAESTRRLNKYGRK